MDHQSERFTLDLPLPLPITYSYEDYLQDNAILGPTYDLPRLIPCLVRDIFKCKSPANPREREGSWIPR